jgi:DNA replication factor GINS
VLGSLAEKVRSKRIVVRFLKPSGQFIGIDLLTYGPFKEEDVATIPFENARPFIASGTAIEVQASLI